MVVKKFATTEEVATVPSALAKAISQIYTELGSLARAIEDPGPPYPYSNLEERHTRIWRFYEQTLRELADYPDTAQQLTDFWMQWQKDYAGKLGAKLRADEDYEARKLEEHREKELQLENEWMHQTVLEDALWNTSPSDWGSLIRRFSSEERDNLKEMLDNHMINPYKAHIDEGDGPLPHPLDFEDPDSHKGGVTQDPKPIFDSTDFYQFYGAAQIIVHRLDLVKLNESLRKHVENRVLPIVKRFASLIVKAAKDGTHVEMGSYLSRLMTPDTEGYEEGLEQKAEQEGAMQRAIEGGYADEVMQESFDQEPANMRSDDLLLKRLDSLEKRFGSVERFNELRLARELSLSELSEMFTEDGWFWRYAGPAWKSIAAATGKLEQMLPVTVENLREVTLLIDHIVDLSHNTGVFLGDYTTLSTAEYGGEWYGADLDGKRNKAVLGGQAMKEFLDDRPNWDLEEKVPSLHSMYEGLGRYAKLLRGLTKFAQSSWGGGSGTGIYGPHQGEGLGIGAPGISGIPHSTNLPPSHQGHGGNLSEGPQSGNHTVDHALETQPFNKTLGDFTVEELMGQIKALMKIHSPESMQQATFLQDVLRDKMQRLKAARRAFDAHIMVKNATITRKLKDDAFVQALFAEHKVPIERLDAVELFPNDLTHFALHNLVHKLAYQPPAVEEDKAQATLDFWVSSAWNYLMHKEDHTREKLEHYRLQVSKALSEVGEFSQDALDVVEAIDAKVTELAQYSIAKQPSARDILDSFADAPYSEWPELHRQYVEGYFQNDKEAVGRYAYDVLMKRLDKVHHIQAPSAEPSAEIPALSLRGLMNFYAVASVLRAHVDKLGRFQGLSNRIVDLVSGVAKTLMAGARPGIVLHVAGAMAYQMDQDFPTIAQKMQDDTVTGKELYEAARRYLSHPEYGGGTAEKPNAWIGIAKSYAEVEDLGTMNMGNIGEAIDVVHIMLHKMHHGGEVLGDYVAVKQEDGENMSSPEIWKLLDMKTKKWDMKEVQERAPQIWQLTENLKRRHAQLKTFAKGGPKMDTLKKNKKPLTDEERKKVMDAGAVWHHGPNGEETPAVWKSEVKGKTWYVCDTHRAYQCKDTLEKAIKSYDFIETTAQTAQPIKGKCPESGEVRYMSQSDLVQNDYKADCPEGKRKLKDQKSVSITEYNKKKKKANVKGFTKTAQEESSEQYVAALAEALKAQDWQRARELYISLPPEVQTHFAPKIRMQFPTAVSAYVLEGREVQEPVPAEPAPTDEEVAKALMERGFNSNAYALNVSQKLGATMVHEDKEDGRRVYGMWRQEGREMLFNIHFYILPKMKAVQLTHYKVGKMVMRIHDPDIKLTDDVRALREKYPNPMQVMSKEAAKYGFSVQAPSMEAMMQGAGLKSLIKRAQEGEIKFNEKEQKIIDAVKQAADDLDINTYLVGGAVRDRLLGKEGADLDFMCEHGADKMVVHLAEKFGTEMPVQYDRSKALMITLNGETVEFVNAERLFRPVKQDESMEGEEEFTTSFDDAYRRDLTINTLMYDLRKGELLDPTGKGLDDLRNKQLNTVIDPYIKYKIHAPDMLRALRFAATHGFELGENMLDAMRANAERVRPRDRGGDISNRRIRKELRKAIDDPQHWAKLRSLLSEAGLDIVLADDIDDVQQDLIGGIDYHLEEKDAMTRIRGLTKISGIFDFWKKKEEGMPSKQERMDYIVRQIDDALAKAPVAQQAEVLRKMLTEWKISQNMPEYAYIMSMLKNYKPSGAKAPGRHKTDIWVD